MEIITVKNELLGESYEYIKHPSGLSIYVYPKKDYATSYALFGTKYGSIDTVFKRSDREEYCRIPEGTAHFLEHKLFESEELDAFERFAKTGASANAFTSFDRTCYLFSCSAHFSENLEILLDFVRSPYFTEETVRKEQGIIGQEIDMYKDSPGWQVFFNLLRALFHNHPVNIDIAGTKESIATITAETLHSCYENFYNLNNMALAVAGNVTVEEVIAAADKYLKPDNAVKTERVFEDEPIEVVTEYYEEKMSVAMPLFALGFKESHRSPEPLERSSREQTVKALLLEVLAGSSSDLYRELIEQGLVNKEFSSEYFDGAGFAATLFSGETSNPRAVADRITSAAQDLKKRGVSKEEFERTRKGMYGKTVMGFNNIEDITNELVLSHFKNENLFDGFSILASLTLEEVNSVLAETFDSKNVALSVVLPK